LDLILVGLSVIRWSGLLIFELSFTHVLRVMDGLWATYTPIAQLAIDRCTMNILHEPYLPNFKLGGILGIAISRVVLLIGKYAKYKRWPTSASLTGTSHCG
jgi:hypothetical protein